MARSVPVVDLARFESQREQLVGEVGAAYREFGFCGFLNHGVPEHIIAEAYAVFRDFFALPVAIKRRYRSKAGGQRGYTPFGTEQARDGTVPDLKEFWHVGREIGDENPWPEILEPNLWPEEIPDFREKALALYRSLDALGGRVLEIIALSLGLQQDWFAPGVRFGNGILRAIHYPPITDPDTPAVRAARHEDINLITVLPWSREAGLEILARDGSWVPITHVPGAMVVNIGDMMKRLTNHVLPSTPHRVVNPAGDGAGRPRYSLPYFMHPNPDFLIATLPSCVTPDNPDRYPQPITADDFLMQRLREIKLL
jgi:isopenicillin N synthase-like dioxygenase